MHIDGHHYTIRRPTAYQRMRLSEGTWLNFARACVVDWDLTYLDLHPGGDPNKAEFDQAVWNDWLDDNPQMWDPLIYAVRLCMDEHDANKERAEKN